MSDGEFIGDMDPLLPSNVSYNPHDAYTWFVDEIKPKI